MTTRRPAAFPPGGAQAKSAETLGFQLQGKKRSAVWLGNSRSFRSGFIERFDDPQRQEDPIP
jgi:hypothetical protein